MRVIYHCCIRIIAVSDHGGRDRALSRRTVCNNYYRFPLLPRCSRPCRLNDPPESSRTLEDAPRAPPIHTGRLEVSISRVSRRYAAESDRRIIVVFGWKNVSHHGFEATSAYSAA